MNLTQMFNTKLSTASNTLGALNTFCEYITARINDLANFVAGETAFASIYFDSDDANLPSCVGVVTAEQYEYALEHPEEKIAIQINDNGDYLGIYGSAVADAVENAIADLKVQEQYILYCLHSETCDPNTFITRARALAPNVPGVLLDKFGQLLEMSGSPIDAIKNYLSTIVYGKLQQGSQYISLIDETAYSGNPWLAAWTMVTDRISSFFANVWEGIEHIDKFFINLINAVGNLAKWAFGKIFSQFLTVYEKASSAPLGVLDLPLFQLTLTEIEIQQLLGRLFVDHKTVYSWDLSNHRLIYNPDAFGDLTSQPANDLARSICSLTEELIDGESYDSIIEVVIPSNPFDVSIRLGKIAPEANSNVVRYALTMYAISDYGTFSQYSDQELTGKLLDSFYRSFSPISSIVPLVADTYDGHSDIGAKWMQICSIFMNTSDLTVEFAKILKTNGWDYTEFRDTYVISSMRSQCDCFVSGVLLYLMIMSKSYFGTYRDQYATNYYDQLLRDWMGNPQYCLYTMQNVESYNIILDNDPINLLQFNASTYKPYVRRNILPFTIHYQTVDDRAREILDLFKTILVAVAVVVVAVKVAKWTKKRKAMTVLAHGNMDRLSWDVGTNPSAANYAAFTAAFNKCRRMDFVNGILGITDGSSTGTIMQGLRSIVHSVGDNYQKGDTNYNSMTNDIIDLQSGESNSIRKVLKTITG